MHQAAGAPCSCAGDQAKGFVQPRLPVCVCRPCLKIKDPLWLLATATPHGSICSGFELNLAPQRHASLPESFRSGRTGHMVTFGTMPWRGRLRQVNATGELGSQLATGRSVYFRGRFHAAGITGARDRNQGRARHDDRGADPPVRQ